jgi:hypothetical protein
MVSWELLAALALAGSVAQYGRWCLLPASPWSAPVPAGQWLHSVGYSRCKGRPSHLCFKTVLASFPAHGSSMTESLSWIRCSHSQRSVNLFLQQRRDHTGLLSSLPPKGAALSLGCPICYWQLYTLSHRLHVSISSGFPRGIGFLKDPSL